jgi:hypothetical protein
VYVDFNGALNIVKMCNEDTKKWRYIKKRSKTVPAECFPDLEDCKVTKQ